MIKIRKRDKELSREEKLDFAAETMFICLISGAILMQLLMHTFVYPFDNLLEHFFWLLLWSFFSFFSHFPAALIFGFAFRAMISLIDLLKIDANAKMILTILCGLATIFLVQHLCLDFDYLISTGQYAKTIIYLFSFGLPFIMYNIYKNIWNSSNNQSKQNPDILDDIQF